MPSDKKKFEGEKICDANQHKVKERERELLQFKLPSFVTNAYIFSKHFSVASNNWIPISQSTFQFQDIDFFFQNVSNVTITKKKFSYTNFIGLCVCVCVSFSCHYVPLHVITLQSRHHTTAIINTTESLGVHCTWHRCIAYLFRIYMPLLSKKIPFLCNIWKRREKIETMEMRKKYQVYLLAVAPLPLPTSKSTLCIY